MSAYIKVRQVGSNIWYEEYYVANILNRRPAFDAEKSVYDTAKVPGETILLAVRKYVLKEAELLGYDIARVEGLWRDVIVSERVVTAVRSQGLTGCDFFQVRLS